MENVPSWYPFVLLALAAYRTWRFVAEDALLNAARRYVTRLPQNWQEGQPLPEAYREKTAEFINCPWCLGFWIAVGWWGLWLAWPNGALIAAAVAAISAVVGLIAHATSDE